MRAARTVPPAPTGRKQILAWSQGPELVMAPRALSSLEFEQREGVGTSHRTMPQPRPVSLALPRPGSSPKSKATPAHEGGAFAGKRSSGSEMSTPGTSPLSLCSHTRPINWKPQSLRWRHSPVQEEGLGHTHISPQLDFPTMPGQQPLTSSSLAEDDRLRSRLVPDGRSLKRGRPQRLQVHSSPKSPRDREVLAESLNCEDG